MLFSPKNIQKKLAVGLLLLTIPTGVLAETEVIEGEYIIEMVQGSSLRAAGHHSRPTLVNVGESQSLRSSRGRKKSLDVVQAASDCQEIVAALGSQVARCEPNALWSVSAIPNDPAYGDLYGIQRIAAPQAWNTNTGSDSVTVAVLDTGVDYTHPDLIDNIWTNPGEIPGNGVDDDNNGWIDDLHGIDTYNNDGDPFDDHMHGTHCAGTIGAKGNNGTGVVGVNWNVKIMGLKFLSSGGGGSTYDAIAAIDYAIENGAKVINGSFGGSFYSEVLKNAIQRAGDAGVLFVAAAGNSTNDNDAKSHYPSGFNLSNIIAVAATDQNDKLAWFSNYGASTVDVAAPGVSIRSTVPGGYGSLSGTSMAAPHVTGLAALVLAQFPSYSATEVKNLILNTAETINGLAGKVQTAGRINAASALGSDGSQTGGGSSSGGSSEPGEGTISDLVVTLGGPGGLQMLKDGKFTGKLKGGPQGEMTEVSLILRNRSGETQCVLGEVEQGYSYSFKGSLPPKVKEAVLSAGGVNSNTKRVIHQHGSKSRVKRARASSLTDTCSQVTSRVRMRLLKR
ncbi:MAG: S8 family serine peptidase [Bdellovibrionales bacterium]|nr:S8 family serine peptidase [Bdellovibrionales bacterium]